MNYDKRIIRNSGTLIFLSESYLLSWQNKFILLADYKLSWQDHKKQNRRANRGPWGAPIPRVLPFSLPLPPFSPSSPSNPHLPKPSTPNKLFFLLLSLIFPQSLENTGFQRVFSFFQKRKSQPLKDWKKERKGERRWRGFGGCVVRGGGGVSASFLGFFLGNF